MLVSRLPHRLRTHLRLLAVSFGLITLAATAQAPGDVRIALVIGNAAYAGAPLANPVNDARAMGETLRTLGFKVIEIRDGSRAQMTDAVGLVQDSLKGRQGVGLLYYAGHGLQMDARNYMVPVDAKVAKAGDIATQTVDVGSVISAFRTAGNRMNIVVLDACRDNPFGGITSGKGLAPLDAPSGTFLAYATAPGNVAEDGDAKSGNGLYTQYLLQELKKPQARIEDVFKRVRLAVRKASSGRQIPWESTSLEDDFQFNDGRLLSPARPTAQDLQTQFSAEKQDWDRIKDSTVADDFYAFLQKYPGGPIAAAANARLNLLSRPQIVVQGGGAGGQDLPYTRSYFRTGDTFETRTVNSAVPGVMTTTEKVLAANARDEIEIAVEYLMQGGHRSNQVKVYDREGGFVGMKGTFVNNPPSYMVPPGPVQPGTHWTQASQIEMQVPGAKLPPRTVVGRVVGRERITVPAGTFDTFNITHETLFAPGGPMVSIHCTFWMAQDIPFPLRSSCDGKGQANYLTTTELVRYTRA